MKTLLLTLITVAGFSASAYGPNHLDSFDFLQNETFTLSVGGYESEVEAKAAAVATINEILSGNIQKSYAWKINQDKNDCEDLRNSWARKSLNDYIAAKGPAYTRLSASFSLTTSFSADGTPSVGAYIKGAMPCVKDGARLQD